MFDNPYGPFVLWLFLSLASFRLTRLVTTDKWPPSKAFRQWVEDRTGEDSAWTELVNCPWCWGVYVTAGVYLLVPQVVSVPLPLLAYLATLTVVGVLGNYD